MDKSLAAAPFAALLVFGCILTANANGAPPLGPDSGLPVPRFVSLRAEAANGRHGPGEEHSIDWVYERVGLPLLVTAESGPWRRVRDPDGAEVWMHSHNLDARRTIYVSAENRVALRRAARADAAPVAYLAHAVVAALTGCEGDWRRVSVAGRVGWVEQDALWGAADCAGL